MAEVNSDLKKLFENYQQQQTFSEYEKASDKKKKNKNLWTSIDANNDGTIDAKDKSKIDSTKKKLLKKGNLFDINGDGKFDQTDVDLFLKGDIDGDGKVSKAEKAFVKEYKDEFMAALQKQKADFKMDGKKYVKGKLAEGLVDGKYYKKGKLYTGTVKDKYYYKGEHITEKKVYTTYDKNGVKTKEVVVKPDGTVTTYTYKDGVKSSAVKTNEAGDKTTYSYDKNGVVTKAITTKKDGTVITYTYKDGVITEAVRVTKDGEKTTYKYKDGHKDTAKKVKKDGTVINYEYKYKTVNGKKVSCERYGYDANKNLVSKKSYTCDENGKLVANAVVTYKYNAKNQLISSTNYDCDKDGNSIKTATNEYTYRDDGSPKSVKTKAYNSKGEVIATVVNTSMINNHTYPRMSASSDGIVITFKGGKTLTLKDGETANITSDGNHIVKIKTKDGKEAVYRADGTVKSKTPADYKPAEPKKAKAGKTTTEELYDDNKKVIGSIIREYDSNGENVVKTTIIEYQADGKTKKSQKIIYDNGEIDERTYNAQGSELTIKKTDSYGAKTVIKNTYAEDGKTKTKQERHDYTADGSKRTDITQTYDKNGKIKKMTRKVYNPADKNKYSICTYKYNYDKNGSLKSSTEVIEDYDGKTKTGSRKYHYNYKTKKVTITYYDKDGKQIDKKVNDM